MGIVECSKEVKAESSHEWIWYHGLVEHGPECLQGFSHQLQHEAYVGPVRAAVLKVVDKMADVLVTKMRPVGITKVSQDLSLEYVLVGAVAIGAQYLHGIIGLALTLPSEDKIFQSANIFKE